MHAYPQPMEVLIQQIDPEGSGCITFAMFRAGVQTYLASEWRERERKRRSNVRVVIYTHHTGH